MEATPTALASGGPPPTLDERSEALRELARRRAQGALTLGELAEAVDRVQTSRSSVELEEALQASTADAVSAPARPRRSLIVILGGYSQKGRWRLGGRLRLVTVLGGAELDLGRAVVDDDEVYLACVCVLGGVRLIVPEGVPVSFSGVSVLGGRSDERAAAPPQPGAPTIHVRLFSLLGGIEISGDADRRRSRRTLQLGEDALHVRLSGLLAVAGLRRELHIPYSAIREVSTEPPELPPAWNLRLGTATPFTEIRHGLIRSRGHWRFYSMSHRD